MKKIIVITGDVNTGKSFLARTLCSCFCNTIYINGIDWNNEKHNPWMFSSVTTETECIIVEDVQVKNLHELVHVFSEGIVVNKQMENPFLLRIPLTVIVLDKDYKNIKLEASLRKRVHIVNCSRGAVIEGTNRLFLQEKIN